MKNKIMVALTVLMLMGFTLIGCDDGDDDDSGTPAETSQPHHRQPPRGEPGRDFEMWPMPSPNPDGTFGYRGDEHGTNLLGYEAAIDEIVHEYFGVMQQQQDTYFYFLAHPGMGHPRSMPLDGLAAMYRELNEQFDFLLIQSHPFGYTGYFTGDEIFVNNPPEPIPDVYFRNQRLTDARGNAFYYTPIRGIQMGRMLYRYFDSYIEKGRNFIESDFYVHSYDDIVNVILGFDYIGVHELGDIITLSLYAGSKSFNFRVIGFYKEGTNFPDMDNFFEALYFGRSVVMPFFELNYEPTDERNRDFHSFYHYQRAFGHIRIMESVDALTESTEALQEIHARYLARVNEIAERHGLRFDIPLLPIPRQV